MDLGIKLKCWHWFVGLCIAGAFVFICYLGGSIGSQLEKKGLKGVVEEIWQGTESKQHEETNK